MSHDSRRRTIVMGGLAAATSAVAGAASVSAAARDATPADRPLAGKVALVTGAARGLARASAVALAEQGARLALVDIADPHAMRAETGYTLGSRAQLDETVALVKAAGSEAMPIVADVRDLDQMRRAVRDTLDRYARLDIVAAIAGVGIADDDFAHYDPARFAAVLSVNVTGVANTVHAARDALKRAGDARVVIISSRSGRIGEGSIAYGASKFAVTGLMKNLALELGADGIRVNCIAPGMADTDLPYFQNKLKRDAASRAELDGRERKLATLPNGIIDPRVIGQTVAFAAGPMVEVTTGATFDCDGGWSARTPA